MATRTISNTGGNYNAVGTWVEGIVPTSADNVVATATSGNLTINVASAARSFNFTSYSNTLTVNATWTVSGVATQIFVSTMVIAGTFFIDITGSGASITCNFQLIPNLSLSNNKTLNDKLFAINININSTIVFSGAFNIDCYGSWDSSIYSVSGSSIITFRAATPRTLSFGNYTGSGGLIINSTSTLSGSTIGIGLGSNTTLSYSAGTMYQIKIKQLGSPITINGNGAEFETYDSEGAFAPPRIINIPTQFKVKYFNTVVTTSTYNPNTTNATVLAGAGALNVTKSMNINSSLYNASGVEQYKPYNLAFNTGVTHSINILNINGYHDITPNTTASNALSKLISATPGTRANINLLNPSQSIIANTDVTDINFTGLQAYTLGSGGTITNSVNVINATIGSGATSVSGGAFTFVN
jgi:hypothetical protein